MIRKYLVPGPALRNNKKHRRDGRANCKASGQSGLQGLWLLTPRASAGPAQSWSECFMAQTNRTGTPWRNSAGEMYDPQILFTDVSELLRHENLYQQAGKRFLPAVDEGSPAAFHIQARHEAQQAQGTQPHLSPNGRPPMAAPPEALDSADRARLAAHSLAYTTMTLYSCITDPKATWDKSVLPGDLEADVLGLMANCKNECEPFLSRLRCLHPLGGVQGWGRARRAA